MCEGVSLIPVQFKWGTCHNSAKDGKAPAEVMRLIFSVSQAVYPLPLDVDSMMLFLDTTTEIERSNFLEWVTCLVAILGNEDLLEAALWLGPNLSQFENESWVCQAWGTKEVQIPSGLPWLVLNSGIELKRPGIVSLLLSYGITIPRSYALRLQETTALAAQLYDSSYKTMLEQLRVLYQNQWHGLLCLMCGPFLDLPHAQLIKSIFASEKPLLSSQNVLDLICAMRNTTAQLRKALAWVMASSSCGDRNPNIELILENCASHIEKVVYFTPHDLGWFSERLHQRIKHLLRILKGPRETCLLELVADFVVHWIAREWSWYIKISPRVLH